MCQANLHASSTPINTDGPRVPTEAVDLPLASCRTTRSLFIQETAIIAAENAHLKSHQEEAARINAQAVEAGRLLTEELQAALFKAHEVETARIAALL